MIFAEFWAGRVGPYLPQSPAVVVQAVEERPTPPALMVTNYEATAKVFEPVEALVLAELAALTESYGPWAAARALFNPINEGGDQR